MVQVQTKKNLIKFFVFIIIGLFSLGDVKAYEFPSNAFYVKLSDNSLGEITLYIPSNQVEFLALDETSQIINVGSSNITAYSPDLSYTITFQPFQLGRYRIDNYQNYSYLDILEISATNIDFITEENVFFKTHNDSILLCCSIVLVGGVILIWLKR